MYYYVYDEYTSDKRFQKQVSALEARLTELELLGRVARLHLFRDPDVVLERELSGGITTVVAVGNDRTIFRLLHQAIKKRLVLALLPVGDEQQACATALGIPRTVDACDVLSARTTLSLDTLLLNEHRCLTSCVIPDFAGEIEADAYRVIPEKPGILEVRNLALFSVQGEMKATDPTDGQCELVYQVPKSRFSFWGSKTPSETVLPRTEAVVRSTSGSLQAFADGSPLESKEFWVKVDPGSLRMVSGKDRLFVEKSLAKPPRST